MVDKGFSFFLLGMLFSTVSFGSNEEDLRYVYGVGVKTCAQYTDSRHLPNEFLVYRSWISGYISGFGTVFTKNNVFLKDLNINSIYEELDALCLKEPDSLIDDSLNILLLPIVKGSKKL